MKLFKQLTFKRVVMEVMYWESQPIGSKLVQVISVAPDPQNEVYDLGEDEAGECFYALIRVDGEMRWKCYMWNAVTEEIEQSWEDEEPTTAVGYERMLKQMDERTEEEDGIGS